MTEAELQRLAELVAEQLRSGVLAEIRGMVAGPRPAASEENGCSDNQQRESMALISTEDVGEWSTSQVEELSESSVLTLLRTAKPPRSSPRKRAAGSRKRR